MPPALLGLPLHGHRLLPLTLSPPLRVPAQTFLQVEGWILRMLSRLLLRLPRRRIAPIPAPMIAHPLNIAEAAPAAGITTVEVMIHRAILTAVVLRPTVSRAAAMTVQVEDTIVLVDTIALMAMIVAAAVAIAVAAMGMMLTSVRTLTMVLNAVTNVVDMKDRITAAITMALSEI